MTVIALALPPFFLPWAAHPVETDPAQDTDDSEWAGPGPGITEVPLWAGGRFPGRELKEVLSVLVTFRQRP